jgi:CRP-like cAMP-binding protein
MAQPISAFEEFLGGLPQFSGLDADAVARLGAGLTAIDAPKGTVIARRGDPCGGIHVVLRGQVKLMLRAPGHREKVVGLLSRGHSYGEAAAFLGEAHQLTAESVVNSTVLQVARTCVLEALGEPAFARGMIATLSRRLRRCVADLEGYTARSGRQRVAAYLTEQLGRDPEAGAGALRLPAPKRVIASYLNLTHEHFSRILAELSKSGLIAVERRVVRVADIEKLRAETEA